MIAERRYNSEQRIPFKNGNHTIGDVEISIDSTDLTAFPGSWWVPQSLELVLRRGDHGGT